MSETAGGAASSRVRLDLRGAARQFVEQSARVNLWEATHILVTRDSPPNARVEAFHTAEQVTVARRLDGGGVAALTVRWRRALDSHRWQISLSGRSSAVLELRTPNPVEVIRVAVHPDQIDELLGAGDGDLVRLACRQLRESQTPEPAAWALLRGDQRNG